MYVRDLMESPEPDRYLDSKKSYLSSIVSEVKLYVSNYLEGDTTDITTTTMRKKTGVSTLPYLDQTSIKYKHVEVVVTSFDDVVLTLYLDANKTKQFINNSVSLKRIFLNEF